MEKKENLMKRLFLLPSGATVGCFYSCSTSEPSVIVIEPGGDCYTNIDASGAMTSQLTRLSLTAHRKRLATVMNFRNSHVEIPFLQRNLIKPENIVLTDFAPTHVKWPRTAAGAMEGGHCALQPDGGVVISSLGHTSNFAECALSPHRQLFQVNLLLPLPSITTVADYYNKTLLGMPSSETNEISFLETERKRGEQCECVRISQTFEVAQVPSRYSKLLNLARQIHSAGEAVRNGWSDDVALFGEDFSRSFSDTGEDSLSTSCQTSFHSGYKKPKFLAFRPLSNAFQNMQSSIVEEDEESDEEEMSSTLEDEVSNLPFHARVLCLLYNISQRNEGIGNNALNLTQRSSMYGQGSVVRDDPVVMALPELSQQIASGKRNQVESDEKTHTTNGSPYSHLFIEEQETAKMSMQAMQPSFATTNRNEKSSSSNKSSSYFRTKHSSSLPLSDRSNISESSNNSSFLAYKQIVQPKIVPSPHWPTMEGTAGKSVAAELLMIASALPDAPEGDDWYFDVHDEKKNIFSSSILGERENELEEEEEEDPVMARARHREAVAKREHRAARTRARMRPFLGTNVGNDKSRNSFPSSLPIALEWTPKATYRCIKNERIPSNVNGKDKNQMVLVHVVIHADCSCLLLRGNFFEHFQWSDRSGVGSQVYPSDRLPLRIYLNDGSGSSYSFPAIAMHAQRFRASCISLGSFYMSSQAATAGSRKENISFSKSKYSEIAPFSTCQDESLWTQRVDVTGCVLPEDDQKHQSSDFVHDSFNKIGFPIKKIKAEMMPVPTRIREKASFTDDESGTDFGGVKLVSYEDHRVRACFGDGTWLEMDGNGKAADLTLPNGKVVTLSTANPTMGKVYIQVALDFWSWSKLEPAERIVRARRAVGARQAVSDAMKRTARILNDVPPFLTESVEELNIAVHRALSQTRRILNS
eukprot:g2809.t1